MQINDYTFTAPDWLGYDHRFDTLYITTNWTGWLGSRWVSIAHELGHRALGHTGPIGCTKERKQEKEKEAWDWALAQQTNSARRAEVIDAAKKCLATYDVFDWEPDDVLSS